MSTLQLCFVCLGNICRSPTAEGVMQSLVREAGLDAAIHIDSAGTAAYHVGERADPRSRATARARGVELQSRGRRFEAQDFVRFDYVLAMDRENYEDLLLLAPDADAEARVHLLRDFDGAPPGGPLRRGRGASVPDPYYGGDDGFERVFDICLESCRGLLDYLVATHGLER